LVAVVVSVCAVLVEVLNDVLPVLPERWRDEVRVASGVVVVVSVVASRVQALVTRGRVFAPATVDGLVEGLQVAADERARDVRDVAAMTSRFVSTNPVRDPRG
jgi:hypothetical protein